MPIRFNNQYIILDDSEVLGNKLQKYIYRRRKNTALPFHFAITLICRQLLNSIDLVFRCAWQKAKNNLWVTKEGHWKRGWGQKTNKESNKTPQKSKCYS